jgi:5-methylcytosine-specific restriction endonuclease McrA
MIHYPEFNYERFITLTKDIPHCDLLVRVPSIQKKVRAQIIDRDQYICQLCGLKGKFGNPHWDIEGDLHIHHRIPNGPSECENLITLCKYCHTAVHLVLYRDQKWRYVR